MTAARYKKFLKLCEQWPLDDSKSGRDLGSFLRQKVAEAFKQGESSKVDPVECDRMYECLQKLNTDYYKNKYVWTSDKGAAGLTYEQCKMAMSNEVLKEFSK